MSAAKAACERYSRLVSEHHGIPYEDMMSRKRGRRETFGRRIVAIILRERGYSYPEIGAALGRDHTSAIRMVQGRWARDRGEDKTAKALAKKIMSTDTVPGEPGRAGLNWRAGQKGEFEDPADRWDFHSIYANAVDAYRRALPFERDQFWLQFCMENFPNSWWAQASMPPR